MHTPPSDPTNVTECAKAHAAVRSCTKQKMDGSVDPVDRSSKLSDGFEAKQLPLPWKWTELLWVIDSGGNEGGVAPGEWPEEQK